MRDFHVLLGLNDTAQKMKFSVKDFFIKCDVRFTEKILNGKFHFCAVKKLTYRTVLNEKSSNSPLFAVH